MLERLDQLNRSFQQRHGITLAIEIGINTGDVPARSAEQADQLVADDAVDVAARLEQSAEPGAVVGSGRN